MKKKIKNFEERKGKNLKPKQYWYKGIWDKINHHTTKRLNKHKTTFIQISRLHFNWRWHINKTDSLSAHDSRNVLLTPCGGGTVCSWRRRLPPRPIKGTKSSTTTCCNTFGICSLTLSRVLYMELVLLTNFLVRWSWTIVNKLLRKSQYVNVPLTGCSS